MQKQQEELENLMEERRKLLMLQEELQRLHDNLPAVRDSNLISLLVNRTHLILSSVSLLLIKRKTRQQKLYAPTKLNV